MNKAVRLSIFVLLVCMAGNTQTISYPAKSVLKRADHIVSLAITATFGAAVIAENKFGSDDWGKRFVSISLVLAGANSIINGMALKHERSVAAILKLLLPVSFLGGYGVIILEPVDKDSVLRDVAPVVVAGGAVGNVIKNSWDVYSLAKYNHIESTQHDA